MGRPANSILYWETAGDGRPAILRRLPAYHPPGSDEAPGLLFREAAKILMHGATSVSTTFAGRRETFGLQAAWFWEGKTTAVYYGLFYARDDLFLPGAQEPAMLSVLQEARNWALQGVPLTPEPSQQGHWRDLSIHVEYEDLDSTLSYNPTALSCLPFEAWVMATLAQFDRCLEQEGMLPDAGAPVEVSFSQQSHPQILALHRFLTGAGAGEC